MNAAPDRVRLALDVDSEALRRDVEALDLREFVYYDVQMLTVPEARSDEPVTDYADGSWAVWRDTAVLRACPAIHALIEQFRSLTDVTLVRLLRLEPGAEVAEHTDPTVGLEVERSIIRLTIPIVTHPAVDFWLNGVKVPLEPGECWYLRFTDPHSIMNASDIVRTHLSIDVIPNETIRELIDIGAVAGGW